MALYDASANGPQQAWRCYAASTLDAARRRYVQGSTYCTRDKPLRRVLETCRSSSDDPPPNEAYSVNPTGGAQRVPPPQQQQQRPQRPPPQKDSATLLALPEELRRKVQMGAIDEATAHRIAGQQAAARQRSFEQPAGIWMPHRPPNRPLELSPPPTYVHNERFLKLSPSIKVPRFEECAPHLADDASFFAISLYSAAYSEKAERLVTSCELVGVCCKPAFVPEGAFTDLETGKVLAEGTNPWRHRLIASKPLFMLEALRASPLPVVWLDVDLEFHQFPTLFTGAAWSSPRDVLLWNWQCNVSAFQGRRLKMASGVGYYNKTSRAEALLRAWAQASTPPLSLSTGRPRSLMARGPPSLARWPDLPLSIDGLPRPSSLPCRSHDGLLFPLAR